MGYCSFSITFLQEKPMRQEYHHFHHFGLRSSFAQIQSDVIKAVQRMSTPHYHLPIMI